MMKRKNFQRPKVNCLCRCNPATGVESLTNSQLQRTMRRAIGIAHSSRSTGVIAATAVRAGQLFENTGHPLMAITIYRTAINRILTIDYCRAEDYYYFGPVPPNPHYRPWSARINDADALEVAKPLDALYRRLQLPDYAHQQRRVLDYYEHIFNNVYAACM